MFGENTEGTRKVVLDREMFKIEGSHDREIPL